MCIYWDSDKAKSNLVKHGINFVDLEPVFYDVNALSIEDNYAIWEQRFIVTGSDIFGRILTVVYTYRGNYIRIISARHASKKEKIYYERKL